MKTLIEKIKYKNLFIIVSIIMLIPSVVYLINNKTIIKFKEWFTFFLHIPNNYFESIFGAIIFGILLLLLIFLYFKILKNSENEFINIKEIIFFVLLISIIFAIMLPFTTSDIFYYMGTGWINSKYNVNPYYETVKSVRVQNPNDEILQRTGIWETQVVVYGPLWTFICKILSFFSFGNATLGLYVFKLAAVFIHVVNTILVYLITKKKKFALLYGINPFILFEMITNVHNDIYLIFFMILSIYTLLKKKNIILTIIFMALATCIKYVSVLLIPFLVLYYLKNEKLNKKILYCLLYAVLFIATIGCIYLLYAKNINMFLIMIMQQAKYRESILAIIFDISSRSKINLLPYAKKLFYIISLLVLIDGLIFMFLYKKKNFINTIRKYNKLIVTFLFLIITNLCPWYTSWLMPGIFWEKGKNIKNILYLQFSYELVTLINFALFSESYKIGLFYLPIMIFIIIIFNLIGKKNKEIKV